MKEKKFLWDKLRYLFIPVQDKIVGMLFPKLQINGIAGQIFSVKTLNSCKTALRENDSACPKRYGTLRK